MPGGLTIAGRTRTTCPYCGVGCGLLVSKGSDGGFEIAGDPAHPANRGRLCAKGAALGETLDLEGRLLAPMVDGRAVSWEAAVSAVAERLQATIAQHGPDSVAFYVSGQLLTEDYYVANKLMKGFIGASNIDTNSRLCMSSAVAGYKRAFGSDTVPCEYTDFEQAELVVLAGSNLAWCHPVLYQRLAQAKRDNPELKVVVVDPRRTETAEFADLHLPLAPGSDAVLFNGLLVHLEAAGIRHADFVRESTEGIDEALASARTSSPDGATVAAQCGLDPLQVEQFFAWFAGSERVVTAYSQGVNQSTSGTDKSNAIINCHLLTGRIGRPGMGPFSLTGQPNAMGGREVGGLANQLAAHMDFTPDALERVGRFWHAPNMAQGPGLKAIEMFEGIERGAIRAIWIMATNPVVSLPEAERVRRALKRCALVVVSECMLDTDTARLAHIRLPALAWGEKDGCVTNSERRISRCRSFLPAPGDARADWWMLTQVAGRMGYGAAFGYQEPEEIFREHAALSAFENDGRRDFDLGACAGVTEGAYREWSPFLWPARAGEANAERRLFSDGRFYTASGRARFIPVVPRPCARATEDLWPLVLNTGRTRDQWHTMSRSGKAPRLARHRPEPFVQIHPQDAVRYGVEDGGLARVSSPRGAVIVRVHADARARPGSIFVPIHWNAVFASQAKVGALIAADADPVSGQPEFKSTPVAIAPVIYDWHGFLVSRRIVPLSCSYWVRMRAQGLWCYTLAGEAPPGDWGRFARDMLCTEPRGEWIEYLDPTTLTYRAARLVVGRLEACLFVARKGQVPAREAIEALFTHGALSADERMTILSGRVSEREACGNPIICACHGVGEETLRRAIRDDGADSVAALGTLVKAGTQCGSCIPELERLLAAQRGGGTVAGAARGLRSATPTGSSCCRSS